MDPNDHPPTPRPGCSHRYELRAVLLATDLGGVFAVFLAIVLLLGGLSLGGFLPDRALLADADSAILSAKAELASSASVASGPAIAVVGDSSCLIDIDVPTLRSEGVEAVNLGTLSYLGIDSFGLLAERFCGGRTGTRILLVVHPEGLRSATTSPQHRALLEAALSSRLTGPSDLDLAGFVPAVFDGFRDRVLDRWIPTPLRGGLGARYGFTADLRREVVSTGGTLEETAVFDPLVMGPAAGDYRFARRIEGECRAFRARLPQGVRLEVLLSPVPASRALREHPHRMKELHRDLSRWLDADPVAPPMPLVLPDSSFGTPTHLLPLAARDYSRLLAAHLRAH